MARFILAILGASMLSACTSGTPIRDLPDMNVSKAPAQWTDPGATPDLPRDAGGGGSSDDAAQPIPDASGTGDAGVDAQASDGPVDAGAADAG